MSISWPSRGVYIDDLIGYQPKKYLPVNFASCSKLRVPVVYHLLPVILFSLPYTLLLPLYIVLLSTQVLSVAAGSSPMEACNNQNANFEPKKYIKEKGGLYDTGKCIENELCSGFLMVNSVETTRLNDTNLDSMLRLKPISLWVLIAILMLTLQKHNAE